MVEVQCEVEDRAGDWDVVDCNAGFVEVPSPWTWEVSVLEVLEITTWNLPDNEDSWVVGKLVGLSTRFEVDFAQNSITQIYLTIDHIGECRCTRI